MSTSNPCGVEQSQETAVAPKHAATLRLHAVVATTVLHLDHYGDSVPALGAGVLNPDHGAVSQNWKRLRVLVVPLLGFCRKRGGCLVNGVAQVAPLLLERARVCQHLRSKGPAEQQLGRLKPLARGVFRNSKRPARNASMLMLPFTVVLDRRVLTALTAASAAPLAWWWWGLLTVWLIPQPSQNCLKACEVNWGPPSVVSCTGMPLSAIHSFRRLTTCSDVVVRPQVPTVGQP